MSGVALLLIPTTLSKLINGTPFPLSLRDRKCLPDEPIDWAAEVDAWLAETKEWREALVRQGWSDEWAEPFETIKREHLARMGLRA